MGLVSFIGRAKISVCVWCNNLSLSVLNLAVSTAIVHKTTKENLPRCTVHSVVCARYGALLAFRRPDCTKNTCASLSGCYPMGGPAAPGPLSLAFSTSAVSAAAADPFGWLLACCMSRLKSASSTLATSNVLLPKLMSK
jgi:hypothetical protein